MAGALRSAVASISRCCHKSVAFLSRFNQHSLLQNSLSVDSRLMLPSLLHTTSPQHGLMEFFDIKKNWGEENVKSGRPWRMDELRIKNNSDLHKLWYVLLKERNMLFTMQHEYEKQSELLPNPERIEKVEESMENIMTVIKERDEAFNLLETGKTGDPGGRYVKNYLGLRQYKRNTEHLIPHYMNKFYFLLYPKNVSKRTEKYIALYKEEQRVERRRQQRSERMMRKRLIQKFPHLQDKL
ncbi:large ribosomal subunit protein uL29m-like [Littorina saxatilis]|uniref:Large ribosomal subunit protein uL29m n=1 Tax=Littorina saxatilis TaxID=31220 RepID=A0AAN9AUH8_9CAEN